MKKKGSFETPDRKPSRGEDSPRDTEIPCEGTARFGCLGGGFGKKGGEFGKKGCEFGKKEVSLEKEEVSLEKEEVSGVR